VAMSAPNLVAVDVGHSRTSVAPVIHGSVQDLVPVADQSLESMMHAIQSALVQLPDEDPKPVVVASVNEPLGERLCSALRDQLTQSVFVIGEDLPIALKVQLAPEAVPGVDRLLSALAAWSTMRQACVVVDAGTCVTVDFVDGEGTFHGGGIAPGLHMQLNAMHTGTTSLPELEPCVPADSEPFGRSTADAMQLGAFASTQGLVRVLAERYATAYDAWPPIVVTGGDAEALFRNDDLIDRIVPDLVLRGIAVAATQVLTSGDTAS
jgi:type III pantothenate kinase